MDSNPFRPAVRETYEDQLDLSTKNEESEELLVDIGLTSNSTATINEQQQQQPKFLETSTSSLLTSGGQLGPNKIVSNTNLGNLNNSLPSAGGAGTGATSFGSRLCGFLSIEYYRPYFDVSSQTVLNRIKGGMSPHKSDLFAVGISPEEVASPPPADLYGAVWIAFTLIFLIGATSNLNSYFAYDSKATEPWHQDYRLLSMATTMVLIYTFVIPLIFWGASLYVGVDPRPSLIKLIGIYGYTMSIFVPASLLCVIPVVWVQWIVVLIAGAISGIVLIRNLWTLFGQRYTALAQQDIESAGANLNGEAGPVRSKTVFLLICSAGAIHAVFSLLLKLFFFQGADLASAVVNPPKDGTGS
jgi:hypothetical protein